MNWCCMCRFSGETMDRLLVHRDVTLEFWYRLLSMYVVHWVLPKTIAELFFGWWNWVGKHGSYLGWNRTPLCLMWMPWREMNNCTFNGAEALVIELESLFVRSLFELSHCLGISDRHSLVDF